MRIAIFGTGAVGGYFGGRLAKAGEDIVFIARGEQLKALLTHGLRVDDPEIGFVVKPVKVTDDPRQVGVVDAVMVGVKAWQVSEAAEAIRPMVGSETFVLPLQNGVEAPDQLAEVIGVDQVLGGLCRIFSSVIGPGHIRRADHGGNPLIVFGEIDNRRTERVERLRQVLIRAGVGAEVSLEIWVDLWMKFLFISPFSAIGGITRAPVGVWRSVPEVRQMAQQAIQEIIVVARARGIKLPEDAMHTTMDRFDKLRPELTSSMQRDVMEGRPSELDAQIGVLVRFGRQNDVITPLYTFIYHSLLPMELRARGQLQFQF